jgi:hypothetical protein
LRTLRATMVASYVCGHGCYNTYTRKSFRASEKGKEHQTAS